MTTSTSPRPTPGQAALVRVSAALDRAEQLLRDEEYDPEVLLVSTPLRVIAYIRSAVDGHDATSGDAVAGSSS
ncbi:hypothetical protein [Curtobacterium sp. MCLR17_042]|uniref:hypothetical protein n=1 Tax=Curtobacterium sp. MCLR17_042 TaxID=2175626 RepID=UPI000DA7DB1C|nr:hypothetical protein [Curtobacterium sp. MCLR17_042]PZE28379.1 hypothetical protein DEJ02_07910 [Curtobacterium sp. MCLR17_042]